MNGIKLQGQIESFDQFVILLKNTVSQMVYKHAISTVVRLARCLTTATMLAAVPVTITTVVARRVLLRRNKTATTPNKASAVFHAGEPFSAFPLVFYKGLRLFDRYDAGEQAVLVHIYFSQDKDMEDLRV